MKSQKQLIARYAKNLPDGKLCWIGIRPERKAPMLELEHCMALVDLGLEGDHRCKKTPGSARQISIISQEFIRSVANYLNRDKIEPQLLRRNLVISGINLNALRYQQFSIGEVILEATALCHPCSRMEQALGPGGLSAMLGYGGLCCKILRSGAMTIGDKVSVIRDEHL